MIVTYIVSIKLPNGTATKIGSTRNWKQRRSALSREYGFAILKDVLVWEAEDYQTALRRERELQQTFRPLMIFFRYNRSGIGKRTDWFNILWSVDEAAEIVEFRKTLKRKDGSHV